MARTVEDCALLAHAVSSRTLPDFATPPERALRIGLCRTSRWKDASPASQAAVESAAAALAKAGAELTDLALPDDFDALFEEQELVMNYEAARGLAHERYTQPQLLSDHLRQKLEAHWAMPRSRYDEAMRHARECRRVFAAFFQNVDVLLTPSAPGEALKGIESTGSSLFNKSWTLLGVPCVTVPHGRGPQGLPLGVQLVGAYDDDARVLKAADWVMRAIAKE
jgi:Asp-tRNA(Asn)/Glu-tRNA(Gln) amidotransferase A subunit family amidase